jgi:hypothetical protein
VIIIFNDVPNKRHPSKILFKKKKKKKLWRFSQLVNMNLTSAAMTPNFKACGVK